MIKCKAWNSYQSQAIGSLKGISELKCENLCPQSPPSAVFPICYWECHALILLSHHTSNLSSNCVNSTFKMCLQFLRTPPHPVLLLWSMPPASVHTTHAPLLPLLLRTATRRILFLLTEVTVWRSLSPKRTVTSHLISVEWKPLTSLTWQDLTPLLLAWSSNPLHLTLHLKQQDLLAVPPTCQGCSHLDPLPWIFLLTGKSVT